MTERPIAHPRPSTDILVQKLHPRRPIFSLQWNEQFVLYAPGHVATASRDDTAALRAVWRGEPSVDPRITRLAATFSDLADKATESWQALATREFAPECLTVYLSNQCQLACGYCYSAPTRNSGLPSAEESHPLPILGSSNDRSGGGVINEKKLEAAVRYVAKSCADRGRPMQLVVHGGGEPTLHFDLLERLIEMTRQATGQWGVHLESYLATHGVVNREQARRLGEWFTRIGISCDGPPDLQDLQRSARGGQPSSTAVYQTIRELRELGANLSVRATITPRAMRRQAEIVSFFVHELGVREIHFEPVYQSLGVATESFLPEHAQLFSRHFLAAQQLADRLDCHLDISGVRLDEIHGPYCQFLRDVLHVVPDGAVSACFLTTDGSSSLGAQLAWGHVDGDSGDVSLDRDRMQTMRQRAARIPERCHECVNVYHCARDCPEVCPVVETDLKRVETPGFRCLLQKELGQAWIARAAENVAAMPPSASERTSPDARDAGTFARLLGELPDSVNPDELLRTWDRATSTRRLADRTMPRPPWADRGFEHHGMVAWDHLRVALERQSSSGLAVYLHLPYCDRKCPFCDCYAVLREPSQRDRESRYVDAIVAESRMWRSFAGLAARPVSTVHLGGGTPSFATPTEFERLVDAVTKTCHVTATTEWALESTTSHMDSASLEHWWNLGFRRLHVGVQTLEPNLRRLIGRREEAAQVLRKLTMALDRGFIVSVDLLYGLTDLSLGQFTNDIMQLVGLGIDGFSLYHLNASARNREYVVSSGAHRRQACADFTFFYVGEELLRSHGYHKNHFAHFALPRDRNLYYTHVARNEDLLAWGTSADGAFGDYVYRHPQLSQYVELVEQGMPPLEGGLREDPEASRLRPFSAALMTGTVSDSAIAAMNLGELVERWKQEHLFARNASRNGWELTASGSWFLSEMLADITRPTTCP